MPDEAHAASRRLLPRHPTASLIEIVFFGRRNSAESARESLEAHPLPNASQQSSLTR